MKRIVIGFLLVAMILTGCATKSSFAPPNEQVPVFVGEGGSSENYSRDVSDIPAVEVDPISKPYESAKIIRTLSYALRTSEYEKDRQFLDQLVQELGGYVSNSYEYARSYYEEELRHLTLQLRIPSSRLGEFQSRFEADRTLNSKHLSQTDVTLTYVDVESRIKNLEARIARFREMIQEADTMSDIIEIERALSDATYELEGYQSQKKDLDSRIDFSQIDIEMDEVSDPLQVKAKSSFIQRLQEGFISGINGFIEGMQSLAIFLAEKILWLTVLGLVIYLFKKFGKWKPFPFRRKRKKELPPDEKEE